MNVEHKILTISRICMASMKCVTCGIGFFSADGGDKCSKCRPSVSQGTETHSGCGCGGHDC